MTRRAGWWVVAAVVVLIGLAGLVVITAFFIKGVRESGNWVDVLSLLLAYLMAMATLLTWIRRQAVRKTSVPSDRDLVAKLRRAVRVQWAMEVGTRQLRQPHPLRVRVRPTSRAVVAGWPEPNGVQVGARLQEPLVLDEQDSRPGRVLVEAFQADPRRQLVILGEAGAGKTTLAMLFTLAMVEAVGTDEPVPVLLSVAGWNPAQQVEQWVARRIVEDYPALVGRDRTGLAAVTQLIEDRRVLPVLDGLDEMPSQLLGAAVTNLDRAAGSGLHIVVTCRGAEFEHAVGQAGPLSQAAVVDIEPVQVGDAALFLTQREVAGSTRWQSVLDSMRRDQDGPVASALSTPLMIALARRAYQPPMTHPEQLVSFATTDEVHRHLLEQFITVVYSAPPYRAKARRWLAFLAHHLHDRVQDPNLRWWQLARAVPHATMTTVIAVIVMSVGALVGLGTSVLVGAGSAVPGAVYGSFFGLSLGLLCGRNAARLAHARHRPTGRSAVLATAGAVVRDLGVLVVTMSAVVLTAMALVLLALYPVATQRAIELNGVVGMWVGALRAGAGPFWLWLVILPGLLAAVMIHGLSAARAGEPHRATLRWRKLPVSLATGLAYGLFIAVLLALLLGLYNVVLAVLVGAVIGLGQWLGSPAAEQAATSPEAVLRSDRAALTVTVGMIAVVVATAVMALLWGFGTPAAAIWAPVGVLVVSVAVVILFGSGTAWISYTIARLWLALWGQLPWRLTRFLRHAHAADVLRQVGSAYQFRHEVMRAYLAHHGPPTRRRGPIVQSVNTIQPRRLLLRSWTWWWRPIGVVLALTILPATALLIVPSPLRASLNSGSNWDLEPAFSPDGTLASVNADGAVSLWDADTGRLRRTLATNANQAHGLAFSPDGTTLAIAGQDGLRLWDPVTGQLHRTLATSWVSRPAFSPDGTTLAAVNDNNVLQLWNLTTGAHRTFPGVSKGDTRPRWPAGDSMAFVSDGLSIATAGDDGVRLWDLTSGQLRRTVTTNWLSSFAFSRDGTTIAFLNENNVLQLWNPATGTLHRTLTHRDGIASMALSPDGLTLATAEGSHVHLRDAVTGYPRRSFQADTEIVATMVFNADGSMLATVGYDQVIRLWNVAML